VRTLRAHAVEIVFLSFESIGRALDVVKLMEAEASHVQVIAFHRQMEAEVMRETMRAGVREFIVPPFETRTVMDSLRQMKTMLERRPAVYSATNHIFSFLPSKAGVGTSTIAMHVSAALARRPNTNVAISDFDLNSGMLRFMLKLTNEYSVTDAIEHSVAMDENLWPQLVTHVDGLDVLHAGRINPNYRIEATQVRNLIGFMRRNYQVLTFDLSGNLERYSLEIMQESRRVFLVCTPEVPSLHLAREKLLFLRDLDLDTRVSVVLNRTQKKPLFTQQQVEDLLGVPVVRVFPNDYNGINRAVTAGTLLEPHSEMGKAFAAFADTLVEAPRNGEAAGKRKFVEFFSASRNVPSPRTN
jgi:pilus assembly protein CpaE